MKTQDSELGTQSTDHLKSIARNISRVTSRTAPKHAVRAIQQVGAVLLVMIAMLGIATADSMPVDPGKDGKSTSDKGTIIVYVKWKAGKGKWKTTPTEVEIAAGLSTKGVADAIAAKLNSNNKLNNRFKFTDPEDKDHKGTYDVTPTAGQETDAVDSINAETKKGEAATGLSYGGEIAWLDSPIEGDFAVAGNVGKSGDEFQIEVFGTSGEQTFALASYDGLTPSQIETDLAAEINQNSNYTASINDGVVYISGARDFLRVDFAATTGSQDFSLSAGAFVPVPEPSSLLLLCSGALGLGSFLRRRMIT